MVRKFAALFALVLTLGLAAAPVAAQDVDADDLSALGLYSSYARTYAVDPAGDIDDPDLLGVMAVGFEFDEADTAEDAFVEFTCGFAGGFMGFADPMSCDELVDEGVTVTDDIAINEADAIEILGEANIGAVVPVNMLAIQDENYIYVIIHLGDDSEGAGDELGGFLVDAEPVDTEVEFSADGTSTGGFYDMLPQEGDAEIAGLVPQADADLGGSATSTPAS